MIHQNCYFYSTVDDFLKTSDSDILKSLKDGSAKLYNKPAEILKYELGMMKLQRQNAVLPRDFMNVAKKKNGVVLVGLIGEGQEINTGEEAGIGQWNIAVHHSDANEYFSQNMFYLLAPG